MSDLLSCTPAAREWADSAMLRLSSGIFGKLVGGVIWTDAKGKDGELLVPVAGTELVSKFNQSPHILLHGHDPGLPKGQVLECAYFESPDRTKFVAAVIGYYAGGDVLSFQQLEMDLTRAAPSPAALPSLPDDFWIQVAADPREVDDLWLDSVTQNAPAQIFRTQLSHNAAESEQELIRVCLTFLALVWNPFVTSIATEAGKAVFEATRAWMKNLLGRLADRRSPVLDIHSHHDGCQISFLLRGTNIQKHYAAHDGLPVAAAHAAKLVANLRAKGSAPRQLVYEFDLESLLWSPSFAVLQDNRIITDNVALISMEQMPSGLSLGLSREKLLFADRGEVGKG